MKGKRWALWPFGITSKESNTNAHSSPSFDQLFRERKRGEFLERENSVITAMSLGYAEKLSYIEDVGKVGMSEIFDPLHVLQEKVRIFSPIPSFSLVFSCACPCVASPVGVLVE